MQGQKEKIEIYAYSFPTICAPPVTAINLNCFTQLQELELADSLNPEDDYYLDIVIIDITREGDGGVAISSCYGWLLSGPTLNQSDQWCDSSTSLALTEPVSRTAAEERDELIPQLQQFWDTEPTITGDSIRGDERFSQIIAFDCLQGKYLVRPAWNTLHLHSTNYDACLMHLHRLRSYLQKNVSLLQEYQSTFNEQLQSGIIKVAPELEKMTQNCFFTPSWDRNTR